MLYRSYFNCMSFFIFYLFLFTTYVQYNFFIRISRATSSHFAKYFCDIYFEYITPCTVMIHATSDAIRVTPLWLCTLRSWATVLYNRVDNTMNGSQEEID
jgi:hypothetical protein